MSAERESEEAQPAKHEHAPGENCPQCWAELTTPLFCESCSELLDPSENGSPFDTLGIPAEYPLNAMALRKQLMSLSRRIHPDFHATSNAATRQHAERNTAELNAAFEILASDVHRADWLVKSLGGPDETAERQMPPEFLMEVLEWNETIEEAREAGPQSSATLDELRAELEARREATMSQISEHLTPLPEFHAPGLAEVRRCLNAVRYLDRSLHEINELRLRQSSSAD